MIPEVSWYPASCWVTFSTQVVPRSSKQDKSAAFLLLPKYKKGNTRDAGCESISARAGQEAEVGKTRFVKPETNVSSHKSLCLRWNSVWPPERNQMTHRRGVPLCLPLLRCRSRSVYSRPNFRYFITCHVIQFNVLMLIFRIKGNAKRLLYLLLRNLSKTEQINWWI